MLSIKDWVSAFAPIASALLAGTAIWVALRGARLQRQIQERQLNINLFDKRYAVLVATQDFAAYILKTDGAVKLDSDEYRRFWIAMEHAEYFFEPSVKSYMKELDQIARDLYVKCRNRDHLVMMHERHEEVGAEILNKLTELSASFLEKPKKVFSPYLQLTGATKRPKV